MHLSRYIQMKLYLHVLKLLLYSCLSGIILLLLKDYNNHSRNVGEEEQRKEKGEEDRDGGRREKQILKARKNESLTEIKKSFGLF